MQWTKVGQEPTLRPDRELCKPSFADLTLLLVEVNHSIKEMVKGWFEEEGAKVATAENGFDALVQVVDFSPDIIYISVNSAKLDGYQTCALIKHNRTYKNIPVIAVTSPQVPLDEVKARIVGFDGFIEKPLMRSKMFEMIRLKV